MISVHNRKLIDIETAFRAIPRSGTDARFNGSVPDNGYGYTHLQGLAAHADVHLLTHSDEGTPAGRIYIVDRRPAERRLLGTFDLPVVSPTEPFYYHAGGCQLVGDCLAVPCETRENRSVVAFFDVSVPMRIREIDPEFRIRRDNRDAAAAGMTDFTRDGRDVWLAAVYDSGTVDFYESPDLANAVPFSLKFSCRIREKDHQAFVLLTDTADRVFAVGLNKTWIGQNTAVLYRVDLVKEKLETVCEVSFTPRGGASLRWGASLEIVSDSKLVLHCTSKHYNNGCHINAFDADMPVRRRTLKKKTVNDRAPDGVKRGRGVSARRGGRARRRG